MKKAIFLMAVIGLLAACGGGEKEKSGEAKKEVKPVDNSTNPDYLKGLEVLNRVTICGTCHKIDEKLIGPAWKDVSVKYAGQDTAINYLVNKITLGGKGVWGDIEMPANSAIAKEDVEAIAKYILLLKK